MSLRSVRERRKRRAGKKELLWVFMPNDFSIDSRKLILALG